MKILVVLSVCVAVACADRALPQRPQAMEPDLLEQGRRRDADPRHLAERRALTDRPLHAGREGRDKRFLIDTFSSAFETVREFASETADKVGDAAETVGGAIADAAETVKDGVVDAAETVRDGVVDAAHAVGDFVTDAADSVADAAARAKELLGPILDQLAQTAGPVAEELGRAALQKLIEKAPELLAQLGEAALQELVTSLVTSAAKRDVNADHVAYLFRQVVESKMNATVSEIHRVLDEVDQFNGKLKARVDDLSRSLKTGSDPRVMTAAFLTQTVADMQHLIATNAFQINLARMDRLVHESIDLFGKKLKRGLQTRLSGPQKRFLITGLLPDPLLPDPLLPDPLDLAQDALALLQQGKQALAHVVDDLHQLAEGLLQPTVENVKQMAQTLLDNQSSLTSGLLSKAMTLLAPFQQQLGPLFTQLTALAQQMGLPALPVAGLQ